RRPSEWNSQNDFCVAGNDPTQLSLWGALVVPRDAVQPIIFLSAETTRGPPRAALQNPLLYDGARDRPAPHFCAGPPPFESPFPIYRRHATQRVRPFALRWRATRAPRSLRPVSQPNTTRPFTPKTHMKSNRRSPILGTTQRKANMNMNQ